MSNRTFEEAKIDEFPELLFIKTAGPTSRLVNSRNPQCNQPHNLLAPTNFNPINATATKQRLGRSSSPVG